MMGGIENTQENRSAYEKIDIFERFMSKQIMKIMKSLKKILQCVLVENIV